MAIARRGSRRIVVEGAAYRWTLRRRPTAGQRSGETPLVVAMAAEEGEGSALIVRLPRAHPGNRVGRRSEAVTPAEVAALIREGRRSGWDPSRPGPSMELTLRTRVAPPGPEIGPSSRRARGRAELEALARVRPPAELDRLALGGEGSGISINGVDLIALVRAAELPHAAYEVAARRSQGDPVEVDDLAGAYAGLGPLGWPKRALLGAPSVEASCFELARDDRRRAKTTLLGCTCGIVECWFLLAQITVLGDFVVWSDFEQFHRDWLLDLGPFVFARGEYLRAIGAPSEV